MSRGQQTFKQRDLTRAIKATVKAGVTVGRVEINADGKIVIVPLNDAANEAQNSEANEWDKVLQ